MMEILIAIFFILVVVGLFLALSFMAKTENQGKQNAIQKELEMLNSRLNTNDMQSLKAAVIDADKILDHALKSRKVKGETMGERLQNAKKLFSSDQYESIWRAHKMRNRLVHELNASFPIQHLQNDLRVLTKAIRQLV